MQLVSAPVSAHTGRNPQGIGGETRCNRREREGNECIDARHERTLTHCPDERLRRRRLLLLLHPLYRHARANGPLATPEFPNREHLEWRIVGKQWQTCNKQSVSDAALSIRVRVAIELLPILNIKILVNPLIIIELETKI